MQIKEHTKTIAYAGAASALLAVAYFGYKYFRSSQAKPTETTGTEQAPENTDA
jgi:hypothetical protein